VKRHGSVTRIHDVPVSIPIRDIISSEIVHSFPQFLKACDGLVQ